MGGIRKFKMGNTFAQKRREREKNKSSNSNESGYESRRTYQDIIKENADFEKYYKAQKIVPDSEWDVFSDYIRRDLPTSFRITGCSKSEAKVLLEIIEGKLFKDLINADSDKPEEQRQKPFCLPWYPNRLGWQLQITRKDIRRSETYFRLHNFLISETATGVISRQEVVSMIPPLLLDVKPHHKVIDMCAAPGSKTAQLIEMMHAEEGIMPEGVVVANDIDNSRCYMLVHQAKRLNSPCIVITNHDSGSMPNITVTDKDGNKSTLKYDRVLCDVPCTGDGTLRKNPDIWLKWNTANGCNLHGVQLRILTRGVELLAVGGRVVYSTCSLNPIENESVIHHLLVNAKGSVRLVDVSDKLPGLIYSKGMSHWLPSSRDGVTYEKYEDVPEKWQSQVRPQFFPPKPEDANNFNLDKCIRILPHQQDTGGFFVAVLEKISPLHWESTKSSTKVCDESGDGSTALKMEEKGKAGKGPPERKRRRIQGYREDPFVFFGEEEPVWPSIREFFGIDSNLQFSCLLTRCAVGKKKNIYFVSPAVRDIVINNQTKIKLINTGVKTFARCDNKTVGCSFRLAQEGLQSIVPYIGDCRRIQISKTDLLTLLNNDDPKFPPEITVLDKQTQDRLSNISQGSCVLEYRGENGLNLDMVGWRGTRSLRVYVPPSDCVHFIRILGGDASKFDKNKFKKEGESLETVESKAIELETGGDDSSII